MCMNRARRGGGCAAVAPGVLAALAAARAPGKVATECSPYARPEELAEGPSPYDSVEVVDNARVKLCHSRPHANGRVVRRHATAIGLIRLSLPSTHPC